MVSNIRLLQCRRARIDRIPLATYKMIERYAAKNKVIAIERLPSRAPGLMEQNDSAQIAAVSDRLFKRSGHQGILVESIHDLADALHHALVAGNLAYGAWRDGGLAIVDVGDASGGANNMLQLGASHVVSCRCPSNCS